MRVIQLNGHLLVHTVEVISGNFSAAELGVLVATNDVVKGGGAQEVLLLETEFLASEAVVIRI